MASEVMLGFGVTTIDPFIFSTTLYIEQFVLFLYGFSKGDLDLRATVSLNILEHFFQKPQLYLPNVENY